LFYTDYKPCSHERGIRVKQKSPEGD